MQLLCFLAEPPSAKTPSMRCLPLGRRRSPLWRACRFSRLREAGVNQQWSPHLKKSLGETFHYFPPLRGFYYKNMASCRQLHSSVHVMLHEPQETLGGQYKASVRPAVMSKTCRPFFCVLRVFEKGVFFAFCFISCSCFSWSAIFNFGPCVCTLLLPLMTGSLLPGRSQISTMMELWLEKINCWARFSKLSLFPTLLFDCCCIVKVLFV